MRMRLVIAALIALALAAGSAAAQPPVARSATPQPAVGLVLDVRGTTEPALKVFREIRAGETIRLASGARLVVLDYQPRGAVCRTMTLEGGVVTFKSGSEPIVEGGVASARDTKCPRRLPVTQAAGAIIQRAAFARLPARPAFMIGGARGAEVATVRVLSADGESVLEAPVSEQQFAWPGNTPDLALSQRYTLELLSREGRMVLGSRDFFTSAADTDTPMVIILD